MSTSRGGQAEAPATHGIGTAVISDKRTVKQKLADANKRAKNLQSESSSTTGKTEHPPSVSTPVPDTQTVAERGGGLGGSASSTPPVDTQTIDQRGGGLGFGSEPKKAPVATNPVQGGLTFKGKKSLNPVVDKRTVKQKLQSAQARKNGGS